MGYSIVLKNDRLKVEGKNRDLLRGTVGLLDKLLEDEPIGVRAAIFASLVQAVFTPEDIDMAVDMLEDFEQLMRNHAHGNYGDNNQYTYKHITGSSETRQGQ